MQIGEANIRSERIKLDGNNSRSFAVHETRFIQIHYLERCVRHMHAAWPIAGTFRKHQQSPSKR